MVLLTENEVYTVVDWAAAAAVKLVGPGDDVWLCAVRWLDRGRSRNLTSVAATNVLKGGKEYFFEARGGSRQVPICPRAARRGGVDGWPPGTPDRPSTTASSRLKENRGNFALSL